MIRGASRSSMRWPVQVLSAGAVAALFLLGSATAAAAQQREAATVFLTGLFGTGLIDSELGLTGGLGAAFGTRTYLVRAILDVHLVQPDDSSYDWDVGSAGPVCRDRQSGGVVDESFCRIDRALTGVSTDASLIIPTLRGGIHVGAGYRFGSGSTPYGLAGYGFNPEQGEWNLLVRVVAGRDLLGLQAVATLPIGRR